MSVEPPSSENDSLLEQHLEEHEDACPMCGYNLHRLRGTKCPECGQSLRLQVALTSPRLAAFHTGLAGLAAGVGFSGLVFLWGLIAFLRYGGPTRLQLALLLAEGVVLAVLLVVWIRRSGRIRMLAPKQRWALALGTWVLSLVAMLLFALSVGF